LTGIAVKVTFEPTHTEVAGVEIETPACKGVVICTLTEAVAVVGEAHWALEVSVQLTKHGVLKSFRV
jgi:hypothetical protein